MVIAQTQSMQDLAPGFASPSAQQTPEVDPEVKRLRYTNDLYGIYAPDWQDYLAAYEGGSDMTCERYLPKHSRETDEDYADRVRRLHYLNYCAPLVDFFTNFIFTETISRDGGSQDTFYRDFIKDVNLRGDDVTSFMSSVSDDAQIFGMSYQMVDMPSFAAGELTEAQAEDLNVRPYWVLIKPSEILDWTVDDFEHLTYLKRVQLVDVIDNGGYHVQQEKYTELYPNRWIISYVDNSELGRPRVVSREEGVNSLGVIPINVVRYKRSKKFRFMGNSFLRDFASNNREVMALTSMLQEFLYKQAFNILAKETDSSISFIEDEGSTVGTSNVLEYPRGAQAPKYISPPADPAQFIQNERQRIVGEMFKLASQDVANELANGEKSSGFSQAQQFSKTVPFIATRADNLERAETALMHMTMRFLGKKWDGSIKYKDRYELTNITDAITQLTSLFRDLQLPSETFLKEELKRLVAEFDGKLSPDKMAKVISEIEALKFSEWQETQKEALVGNAGSSPAEQQKPKSSGTSAEIAAEAKSQPAATTKLKSNTKK